MNHLAEQQMRVFITGGSGFIGTNVVDHFGGLGWTVLNFDIAPPKKASQRPHWIEGDIRDVARLAQILGDFRPDYVLNLAATTGADRPDLPPEFFDTNTRGVEALIAAIEAAGTVKRALFVSSLLVCRNGYVPSHDEDYCAPGPYGASKVEGERIVRARASAASEWLIVRPTSIWGPWFAHSYLTFFRLISRGWYVHLRRGRDVIKPRAYVANVAYMMERLLTASSNAVSAKTFYLLDYPETTVGDWADAIQRSTGSRPIAILPLWPIRVAAGLGDLLKRIGWKDPPITRFRLENLLTGGRYPTEPLKEIVGDLPITMPEGVDRTVDWLRSEALIRR